MIPSKKKLRMIFMKYGLLFLIPFLFFISCHGVHEVIKPTKQSFAPENSNPPNVCSFKGKIISISNDRDADTSSICHRYPCTASVAILEVQSCGSSVTEELKVGDIIMMHFILTTAPSQQAIPTLKNKLSGLHNGDIFKANATQRISFNNEVKFVVSDYLVQ